MRKINYIMSWVAIALAFTMLLTMAVWMVYPYEPVIFDNETLTILTCECEPGDRVAYQFSGEIANDYSVTISKTLIDGIIFTYPSRRESVEEGRFDYISQDMKIPEFVTSGTYYIVVTLEFKVNPIRTVVVRIESNPFVVTSPIE